MQDSGSDIDIGAILASGGNPFAIIEEMVRALAPGEGVVLLAPFEPMPLYQHFGAWGVTHEAEETASGYRILVRKETETGEVGVPRFLDLRNLLPPEPLTRTIEAYEALNDGECLVVHLPHCPDHLRDFIERNDIAWEEQAQADGSIHIYMMKGVPG